MNPEIKKAALAIAEASEEVGQDHKARALSFAEEVKALQKKAAEELQAAAMAETQREAAVILSRLVGSDLLPIVLGERDPSPREAAALGQRGLMRVNRSSLSWRNRATWLPIRADVVDLYRRLSGYAPALDPATTAPKD